jgi:hypothetical protein
MKDRADYEKALVVVESVVRDWNPYSLLDGETPGDEFDAEIAQLVTYIPSISSPTDAALAISAVFSKAFEPELFKPSDCSAPGKELFARLASAGLVRRP